MLQNFISALNKKRKLPEVTDIRNEDDIAFLEESKESLMQLEDVRQVKLKTFHFRKKIGIALATVLLPILGYTDYWLMFLRRAGDDSGAGISLLFLVFLYRWVTSPKRQYAKTYKQVVLPKIAQLFGNFSYKSKGRISADKMKPSKIFPSFDRYKSEDYFIGTYKGVDIEFSEIHLETESRDSDGNRTYSTVFKGLAILLDMQSKKFYGHTFIDRDKGKITEWFKEKSSKMKRANLVDPEFEKLFDVYTNDQVEARYLIDPVMIERLKGVQDQYDGDAMTAAFYESKMLVLIKSSHNYFEPADLEIPATDPRSILQMKKEIGEILSLIDRLSLYDPQKVHEQNDAALNEQGAA